MVQQLHGGSLESRVARLQELTKASDPEKIEEFRKLMEMSWIYHDSALEGVVYTPEELNAALVDGQPTDAAMVPVFDEIRNHKTAIDMIYEMSERKRFSVSLDVIKKIYAQLAPEELEGRGQPTYRKDMPLHRLYFHDISTPDKISYKMRQLIQWANSADTKRSTHAVRLAAKVHYQLLHIYPFPRQTGKVARLVMNLILLRHGYPPVIVHATQRQRYYDALKGADEGVSRLIHNALGASVESAVRFFEHVEEPVEGA
ncbi:MAG: Fic family protein [Sandaracinus sp.]|nr:Fic family protein [Myxococcales bacterium]MCB9617119.1 Fic family protein [Sandaracinus sp.]MCB9625111.1 Fic family protein [Sandaracinus sp.]MCB9634336.1 Fic family protein [Sandaracinus sp.]